MVWDKSGLCRPLCSNCLVYRTYSLVKFECCDNVMGDPITQDDTIVAVSLCYGYPAWTCATSIVPGKAHDRS